MKYCYNCECNRKTYFIEKKNNKQVICLTCNEILENFSIRKNLRKRKKQIMRTSKDFQYEEKYHPAQKNSNSVNTVWGIILIILFVLACVYGN